MNKDFKRYPYRQDDLLQAWDSADELLLEEAGDPTGKRILIINDSFGALACSLQSYAPVSYTDSFVSAKAAEVNSKGNIKCVHELSAITGLFDLVLMKIPKNMSFLEDLLCHLTQHITPSTKIVCGAMVKHLAKTSFDLLQKYIGETTTSLAKKKARLIFVSFQKEKTLSSWPIYIKLDGLDKEFLHHSNLFSREKLDIGTRFFLEHLPSGKYGSILDLGCGNGIVGIEAKRLNPDSQILFSDDSNMAIQSSRANYFQHFKDDAHFFWTNCFENQQENSLDLVLCNPPFHQQHTVGDFIAWQMFSDAYHSLRKNGLLRIIGNSHLGYHLKLKKIFGNSRIVASNQKFTIIDALK